MKPTLHTPENPSVTADTPKVTPAQLERALGRLRQFPDATACLPALAFADIDRDARAQQAAGLDLPIFN